MGCGLAILVKAVGLHKLELNLRFLCRFSLLPFKPDSPPKTPRIRVTVSSPPSATSLVGTRSRWCLMSADHLTFEAKALEGDLSSTSERLRLDVVSHFQENV
jgi:hypothetical protein